MRARGTSRAASGDAYGHPRGEASEEADEVGDVEHGRGRAVVAVGVGVAGGEPVHEADVVGGAEDGRMRGAVAVGVAEHVEGDGGGEHVAGEVLDEALVVALVLGTDGGDGEGLVAAADDGGAVARGPVGEVDAVAAPEEADRVGAGGDDGEGGGAALGEGDGLGLGEDGGGLGGGPEFEDDAGGVDGDESRAGGVVGDAGEGSGGSRGGHVGERGDCGRRHRSTRPGRPGPIPHTNRLARFGAADKDDVASDRVEGQLRARQ